MMSVGRQPDKSAADWNKLCSILTQNWGDTEFGSDPNISHEMHLTPLSACSGEAFADSRQKSGVRNGNNQSRCTKSSLLQPSKKLKIHFLRLCNTGSIARILRWLCSSTPQATSTYCWKRPGATSLWVFWFFTAPVVFTLGAFGAAQTPFSEDGVVFSAASFLAHKCLAPQTLYQHGSRISGKSAGSIEKGT